MTRALITLVRKDDYDRALRWITQAPEGTRVEFKAPRRTLPQNDKMWAMLGEFATQVEHGGRKYDSETWKCIFLHALGRETTFLPSLDGTGLVAIGQSSRDLSKEEMSNLIELIHAEGAARNVTFHDPETARLEAMAGRAA